MKAIAIYSGKGGVGKSTISALFALALSKKHKVALVDMDINTPSIPVLFGGKTQCGKNLQLFSYGFLTTKPIILTGAIVRKALKELTKAAKDTNPDIIIMDMPPGTGDIQLAVATKLKPSSFVLVVQPNKLSEEDAVRATAIFMKTGVPISGVIRNMAGKVFGEEINVLNLPTLARIPLREDVATMGYGGKIHKVKDNPMESICEELFEKATDIDWDVVKAQLYEGAVEYGDLIDRDLVSYDKLKFFGVKSWDVVRQKLKEYQPFPDKFLEVNTAERIKEMLDSLDEDMTGLFMVTDAPNTEVRLFPGEIGSCILSTEHKYFYGVPRMLYQTDEGHVTLFSHEIKPVTAKLLLELEKDEEIMKCPKSIIPRHLPTVKMMKELEFLEWKIGLPHDWEERYEKLGMLA